MYQRVQKIILPKLGDQYADGRTECSANIVRFKVRHLIKSSGLRQAGIDKIGHIRSGIWLVKWCKNV